MQRIESIDDPRAAPYRNLPERTLRGESIFIAEGRLLAERLLESRYQTESVLVSELLAEEFQRLAGDRAPVYVAPAALLREVAGFPFHRGVLAAGRRGEPRTLGDLVASKPGAERTGLVVCPAVTQPENLGLVFRTAAAFGLDGVLLGRRACDPLSRRCLRLSMGGVLRVPFARSDELAADLRALKDRWKVALVAAVLDPQAEPLPRFAWPRRAALVLGNEFAGLDAETLALCDHRVTIPMQPGTDSLNLGVAAGILVYEMTRGVSGEQPAPGERPA